MYHSISISIFFFRFAKPLTRLLMNLTHSWEIKFSGDILVGIWNEVEKKTNKLGTINQVSWIKVRWEIKNDGGNNDEFWTRILIEMIHKLVVNYWWWTFPWFGGHDCETLALRGLECWQTVTLVRTVYLRHLPLFIWTWSTSIHFEFIRIMRTGNWKQTCHQSIFGRGHFECCTVSHTSHFSIPHLSQHFT